MRYKAWGICSIVGGELVQQADDDVIEFLVHDSRKIQQPSLSLFFALVTGHGDGHHFIADAYKKGVRNFVVSSALTNELPDSNIIYVDDCLNALQLLAAYHRQQFNIPVVGITGSNGKTVVKEWLFQLLADDYSIVRSPKSYNSQIGVPLSIWQMNSSHTLALIEAGISAPGEMEKLQRIIAPNIGILTNIGRAHSEGFRSEEEKLLEKLKLFKDTPVVIARARDLSGREELLLPSTNFILWGDGAEIGLVATERRGSSTALKMRRAGDVEEFIVPFTDEASTENAVTCICLMMHLGIDGDVIRERLIRLHAIDMRLQLNHGINDCLVINDSYSADLTSLRIALDFLRQQSSGLPATVILSEFSETGETDEVLYSRIAGLLNGHGVKRVIAIGERISEGLKSSLNNEISLQNFLSTDDFIHDFRSSQFSHEIILVKGARRFGFERIARLFEIKRHQTVLEISLDALGHNLKAYRSILRPQTKVMVMVKAFSYGSGGAEIASVLQYHNVEYLGVAYADEGIDLVRNGISIPIMVMNAEASSFGAIVDAGLQPVIYSFELLHQFESYLREQALNQYPVHLEIETGMNRLGFSLDTIEELGERIQSSGLCSVQSVFSHLAASEEPANDDYTRAQAERFQTAVGILKKKIAVPFLSHISNSAAIIRHPALQFDMVRLGIGVYGIEVDSEGRLELEAVATLHSTIAQIKHLKKGETVGYNRRGQAGRDAVIATVRIGYADGYSRRFGNGVGKMWVKGKLAPVIGTVCMDMTMIDITDISGVEEGEDVIVFGPQLPVQDLAASIGTIPYEIMTGISHRVKRVYFGQ